MCATIDRSAARIRQRRSSVTRERVPASIPRTSRQLCRHHAGRCVRRVQSSLRRQTAARSDHRGGPSRTSHAGCGSDRGDPALFRRAAGKHHVCAPPYAEQHTAIGRLVAAGKIDGEFLTSDRRANRTEAAYRQSWRLWRRVDTRGNSWKHHFAM
jgi:hypothetical protein